jgi:hypothetical protein
MGSKDINCRGLAHHPHHGSEACVRESMQGVTCSTHERVQYRRNQTGWGYLDGGQRSIIIMTGCSPLSPNCGRLFMSTFHALALSRSLLSLLGRVRGDSLLAGSHSHRHGSDDNTPFTPGRVCVSHPNFLDSRPFPRLAEHNIPSSSFSCLGDILKSGKLCTTIVQATDEHPPVRLRVCP